MTNTSGKLHIPPTKHRPHRWWAVWRVGMSISLSHWSLHRPTFSSFFPCEQKHDDSLLLLFNHELNYLQERVNAGISDSGFKQVTVVWISFNETFMYMLYTHNSV